ncbi:MAG: TOBE domain-containing protein, partial [Spirochaetaceae bacterium]|nr:TOBE domain-containing protein [Spirochaetaceae bacterium]
EALSVSDRIAVMNRGKLLQVGTPFEIYESPATEFVAKFIGETNIFSATVKSCEPFTNDSGETENMVILDTSEFSTQIQVTDYEDTNPGQEICFTVRPEKIRITIEPPNTKRKDVNIFSGIVEEAVYSGFQSKFYVRLENGTILKVFKQHNTYLDDGPEIEWKDKVFVSWTANDGYIVEDIVN